MTSCETNKHSCVGVVSARQAQTRRCPEPSSAGCAHAARAARLRHTGCICWQRRRVAVVAAQLVHQRASLMLLSSSGQATGRWPPGVHQQLVRHDQVDQQARQARRRDACVARKVPRRAHKLSAHCSAFQARFSPWEEFHDEACWHRQTMYWCQRFDFPVCIFSFMALHQQHSSSVSSYCTAHLRAAAATHPAPAAASATAGRPGCGACQQSTGKPLASSAHPGRTRASAACQHASCGVGICSVCPGANACMFAHCEFAWW